MDAAIVRLNDDLKLDRKIKHNIEIVIDRLSIEPKVRPRLAEAVDQALLLGEGNIIIAVEKSAGTEKESADRSRESGQGDEQTAVRNKESGVKKTTDLLLSAHYACTHCNISYEPPSPQLFSFNSPHGMCTDCDGLGNRFSFDPELLVPDAGLSFYDGAVPIVGPLRGMGRWRKHTYEGVARTLGIDLKVPSRRPPRGTS